jgi:hypothetical protein
MEELHKTIQQFGQLHQHLKKFEVFPPEYIAEVKRVYAQWAFLKALAPRDEPFPQMERAVSHLRIDFYLAGIDVRSSPKHEG